MTDSRDNIYATPREAIDRFAFDDRVAAVFPDMIQRSVPGYSTIVAMTGVMADRYAKAGTRCYDLGCSLGASSFSMAQYLGDRNCTIVAVDNSEAMLTRLTERLQDFPVTVDAVCADIRDIAIENASVVVLNFTLQFLEPETRDTLLDAIYQGMVPGGVLILSEKIRFADDHLQELNTDLHHAFKKSNGYSDLEIAQKRSALENVLQPETIDTHEQRLARAGFSSVDVWFQCFNFASLVAIKS
ncbi:tRNA (cmo5U34)-methyltransferase [Litorivivens lipolytica]|uniref:Carboxy-S-adenosyl-L-methionine synthase n=1 Tax=Litorivivens lipolytica TaxID=1524264 RepID=A0A7W4Z5F0_9GAMM|nr:carboxy-S-adenosyl-L-methionine synthase CmoA [Litorivivens lipolytica]MBB3047148.1 tRNA (cmo5U34)-methyltransferase [Litorivivens lipolytica]